MSRYTDITSQADFSYRSRLMLINSDYSRPGRLFPFARWPRPELDIWQETETELKTIRCDLPPVKEFINQRSWWKCWTWLANKRPTNLAEFWGKPIIKQLRKADGYGLILAEASSLNTIALICRFLKSCNRPAPIILKSTLPKNFNRIVQLSIPELDSIEPFELEQNYSGIYFKMLMPIFRFNRRKEEALLWTVQNQVNADFKLPGLTRHSEIGQQVIELNSSVTAPDNQLTQIKLPTVVIFGRVSEPLNIDSPQLEKLLNPAEIARRDYDSIVYLNDFETTRNLARQLKKSNCTFNSCLLFKVSAQQLDPELFTELQQLIEETQILILPFFDLPLTSKQTQLFNFNPVYWDGFQPVSGDVERAEVFYAAYLKFLSQLFFLLRGKYPAEFLMGYSYFARQNQLRFSEPETKRNILLGIIQSGLFDRSLDQHLINFLKREEMLI